MQSLVRTSGGSSRGGTKTVAGQQFKGGGETPRETVGHNAGLTIGRGRRVRAYMSKVYAAFPRPLTIGRRRTEKCKKEKEC